MEKRSYTGNRENRSPPATQSAYDDLGPSIKGTRQSDKKATQEAQKAQEAMRYWHSEITKTALLFESRWTLLALKRTDPAFADALRRGRNLFVEACVRGTHKQIHTQGAGVVRGFVAAANRMEQAGAPDDAYLVGQCPDTGTMIAIGVQAAQERVREVYGDKVAFFTADELAALCGRVEALRTVAEVKRKFPGAVVNAKSPAPEPPGGAFDYPPD